MCEIAKVLKYLTGFLTKEASPKVCGSKWQLHYQESRVDQCCEREPGKKKKKATAMVPSSCLSSPHQTPYPIVHKQWSRSQSIKFLELSWRNDGDNN